MRIVTLDESTKQDLLNDLLKRSPNHYGEFIDRVNDIIGNVRKNGDAAIFDYTKRFDGAEIDASNIRVTEEEIQANKDKLAASAASAESGNTLDAAAVEQGFSAYSGSYGWNNTAAYPDEVINALDEMAEGDVSDVIETETELYLVQLTDEFDEEATESRKNALIAEEQTAYYSGVMTVWMQEYPLTVDEAVWADVKFDRSYVIIE